MVYLLKMVIFHGYVSLPGGILYLVAELPNPWFIRFDLVSTATESWAASIASFWWTGVTCASCHEQHRSAHISIACVYIYIILKEMQYGLFKDILILVMFLSQFRTAYMCIYMCVCKCLYSYIYVCVCACVCVSRSLSLHCQRIFRAYIYIYVYTCVCVCVRVCKTESRACVYAVHVCVRVILGNISV